LKSSPLWRLYIITLVVGTLTAFGAIGFLIKNKGRLTLPSAALGGAALVILGLRRRYLFPKVKALVAKDQMKKP
jgi:hypothetical protein